LTCFLGGTRQAIAAIVKNLQMLTDPFTVTHGKSMSGAKSTNVHKTQAQHTGDPAGNNPDITQRVSSHDPTRVGRLQKHKILTLAFNFWCAMQKPEWFFAVQNKYSCSCFTCVPALAVVVLHAISN
jgi:hypothetical protein